MTRKAFVVVTHGDISGGWQMGEVEENTEGYWERPERGVFDTREKANTEADRLNEELGLTSDIAQEIIRSSF